MNTPDTTLEVRTLGQFSITANGTSVLTDWPNETVKVFFCSLLSPLDLYFTWDRMCRSMCGVPATQATIHRLEEIAIRPLNRFLIKELGFNPLIVENKGIRLNHGRIHVDALEFYGTVLEGIRLFPSVNNDAALEKFSWAYSLYTGSYLPGISGKITVNTRNELDSLYRTVVMDGVRQAFVRNAETTRHNTERKQSVA